MKTKFLISIGFAVALGTACLSSVGAQEPSGPGFDGVLDLSFSPQIFKYGEVQAAASLPGSMLLLGGEFEFINGQPTEWLARVDATGVPDASFQPPARPWDFSHLEAIVPLPNGKIVVAYSFNTLDALRLAIPGVSSFGLMMYSQSQSNVIRTFPTAGLRLLLLNADGSLDLTRDPVSLSSVEGAYLKQQIPGWHVGSVVALGTDSVLLTGSYFNERRNMVIWNTSTGELSWPTETAAQAKAATGGAMRALDGSAHVILGTNEVVKVKPDRSVQTLFKMSRSYNGFYMQAICAGTGTDCWIAFVSKTTGATSVLRLTEKGMPFAWMERLPRDFGSVKQLMSLGGEEVAAVTQDGHFVWFGSYNRGRIKSKIINTYPRLTGIVDAPSGPMFFGDRGLQAVRGEVGIYYLGLSYWKMGNREVWTYHNAPSIWVGKSPVVTDLSFYDGVPAIRGDFGYLNTAEGLKAVNGWLDVSGSKKTAAARSLSKSSTGGSTISSSLTLGWPTWTTSFFSSSDVNIQITNNWLVNQPTAFPSDTPFLYYGDVALGQERSSDFGVSMGAAADQYQWVGQPQLTQTQSANIAGLARSSRWDWTLKPTFGVSIPFVKLADGSWFGVLQNMQQKLSSDQPGKELGLVHLGADGTLDDHFQCVLGDSLDETPGERALPAGHPLKRPSYWPQHKADRLVKKVVAFNDGSVVIVGSFWSVNGIARNGIARIKPGSR